MATKTNVKVHGKDYYRIRRTIDGVQKSFYGKSKGDAEQKYKKYLEELAEKKHTRATEFDSATFSSRAEEYIQNSLKVSQKYAKGTVERYIGEYHRHIENTWLSDMKIKDIRPADVQRFYNELDISQHGIKEINKFMSGFVKWLQLNGYADDFLSAVEIPRKEDTSRHNDIIVWENDEIKKIFDALDSMKNPHRQDFLIRLLLYSGLRISEALGLKYSDVYDNVIHVERQYYLGELKEPKWGSKRIVPMHPQLKEWFECHKKWHEDEMRRNKYKTEFIFTTSTGQLYHQASVRKALMRFYKKYDISYKHIHAYRATFCTQMCVCGVPLEITSKILGHKSLEVTAAHYALVRKDSMQDAIDRLNFDF